MTKSIKRIKYIHDVVHLNCMNTVHKVSNSILQGSFWHLIRGGGVADISGHSGFKPPDQIARQADVAEQLLHMVSIAVFSHFYTT